MKYKFLTKQNFWYFGRKKQQIGQIQEVYKGKISKRKIVCENIA